MKIITNLICCTLFTLTLQSASAQPEIVTLTRANGKSQSFERGIDESAFRVFYQQVVTGRFYSLTQEGTDGDQRVKITFSPREFQKMEETLKKWESAPQFIPAQLPKGLISENGFHIDPNVHVNKFYITNSLRKNPILYTSRVCECVVVTAYNPDTAEGFLAHLTYWNELDLPKEIRKALKRIEGNLGNRADSGNHVVVHLITRHRSNFAQGVLEIFQGMGINPKVSSAQKMIMNVKYIPEVGFHFVHQFLDPKQTSFDDYLKEYVHTGGREIYLDTRDGQIYEKTRI